MLTSRKGTVRHPKFSEAVEELAEDYVYARRIIDGAIWEIERDPTGVGIYIPEYDVWQARLGFPPILLIYSCNRRFVSMLTILKTAA